MYTSIRSIPQLPKTGFQSNVAWRFLDGFFETYPFVNLDPPYQRGYVWSQEQKERYIEFRLRGGTSGRDLYFNCPNFSMIHTQDGPIWQNVLELVDGKQRLNAVREFMAGTCKAFGKYRQEYDDAVHAGRHHLNHDFVIHVGELQTEVEVLDWYIGMNAGGSVHTAADLQIAYDLKSKVLSGFCYHK